MRIRTSIHLRRLAFATAGAAAVVALMLTAPVGNAIPESTIANECIAAGGTYTTTAGTEGDRHSKCCYRDINDVKHCDNYVDGTYTNTTDSLEQPTTSPPPPPPGGLVGPPATAVEQQPAPPPGFGGSEMTLYMPPPAGPAAPRPGEATSTP